MLDSRYSQNALTKAIVLNCKPWCLEEWSKDFFANKIPKNYLLKLFSTEVSRTHRRSSNLKQEQHKPSPCCICKRFTKNSIPLWRRKTGCQIWRHWYKMRKNQSFLWHFTSVKSNETVSKWRHIYESSSQTHLNLIAFSPVCHTYITSKSDIFGIAKKELYSFETANRISNMLDYRPNIRLGAYKLSYLFWTVEPMALRGLLAALGQTILHWVSAVVGLAVSRNQRTIPYSHAEGR